MKVRRYTVNIYREMNPQINLRRKSRYTKKYHLELRNSQGFVRDHSTSRKVKDLAIHLANILTDNSDENGSMILYNVSYNPRGGASRELTDKEYLHFHRHVEKKLERKELFLLNCLGRLSMYAS